MEQLVPSLEDIKNAAFPLQYHWQSLEEVVMIDKSKRLIASPPPAPVEYQNMTDLQKWAANLVMKFTKMGCQSCCEETKNYIYLR